jgi:alginate O-acetyltransferase complex protein AlgI
MLFCTQQFLFFFLAVFAAYWSLPWHRLRVWLLLAASYYFYASWNPMLASLIFLTTTVDYAIARALDGSPAGRRRRALLALSIGLNVSLLVYFKYANFFLDSLREWLRAAGVSASLPVLEVLVPVGISFYTFEAISYTVDVYRRKIPAERDLAHFLLFILFFPHLFAGPIVRASDFLPQVRRRKRWNWPRFAYGGRLILLGLLKKLAVADRMALLVDPVFADPTAYGSGVLWLAAVAYAFQVYCDFSGYSDLALGTAQLLGYRLAVNFNLPFLAANVAEFWRRWHISLSSWIRDYLFFPLGGSRAGGWRTARNVLIAMTLCGLWHGARWPCVVWGLLNGVYMGVHRLFRPWAQRRPRLDALLQTAGGTALRVGLTFLTFVLALVVFRTASLASGAAMLGRMFAPRGGLGSPVPALCFWATAAVMAAAHALGRNPNAWRRWERLPSWAHGLGYAALLAGALLLAPVTSQAFLYFQF